MNLFHKSSHCELHVSLVKFSLQPYVLRNRLQAYFEAYFGISMVYNNDSEEYDLREWTGTDQKIKCRYTPAEGVNILIHPQFSFSFKPITDKIAACRTWIEKYGERPTDDKRKLEFLKGLEKIIKKFNEGDQKHKEAMECLKKIVTTKMEENCHIKDYKTITEILTAAIGGLNLSSSKTDFFDSLYDQTKIDDLLKNAENCEKITGVLNNSTLARKFFTLPQWWNVNKFELDFEGRLQQCFATIAIQFLMMDKNQSSIERCFKSFTRREYGRPRIFNEGMLQEEQIKSLIGAEQFFKHCDYSHKDLNSLLLSACEDDIEEDQSELSSESHIQIITEALRQPGMSEVPLLYAPVDDEDDTDDTDVTDDTDDEDVVTR